MSVRGEVGWEDLEPEEDYSNNNTRLTTRAHGLSNGTVSSSGVQRLNDRARRRSSEHSKLNFSALPSDFTEANTNFSDKNNMHGRNLLADHSDNDNDEDFDKSHAGDHNSSVPDADTRQQRFRELLENMPDEEPVWSNVDDVETPDSASEADAATSRAEVPFLLQSFVPTFGNSDPPVSTKPRTSARQRKQSTASSSAAAAPRDVSSDDDEKPNNAARAHNRKQQQKQLIPKHGDEKSKKSQPKSRNSNPSTTDKSSRHNVSTSETITDGNEAEEEQQLSSRRSHKQRRSVNGSDKNVSRKPAHEKIDSTGAVRHAPAATSNRRRAARAKPPVSVTTTERTSGDVNDFDYDDDDGDDVENETFTNTYFTETAQSERYTTTSVATDKTMTLPYNPQQQQQHMNAVRTPYGTFLPYPPANASMYWQPTSGTPGAPYNMAAFGGGMMMHPSANPYAAYYNQQQMMPAWSQQQKQQRMPSMVAAGGQMPFMMMTQQQQQQSNNTNSLSRRHLAAEAAAAAGSKSMNRPNTLAFQQPAVNVAAVESQRQKPTDEQQQQNAVEEQTTATAPEPVKQFTVPHAVGTFFGGGDTNSACIVLEFQRKFPGELNFAIMPALPSSAMKFTLAGDSSGVNQPLNIRVMDIVRHFPGNLPLLALLHKNNDAKQRCAQTYSDSITLMPVEKQVFALCDKIFAFFSKPASSANVVANKSDEQQSRSDECLLWELLMLFCQPNSSATSNDLLDVMLEKIIRSYVIGNTSAGFSRSQQRGDNGETVQADGSESDENGSSDDDDDEEKRAESKLAAADDIITKIKLCLLHGDRTAAFEASLHAVRDVEVVVESSDSADKHKQQTSSSDAVIHSVLLGAIVDNGFINGNCLVRLSRLLYSNRSAGLNSHTGAALSTLYKIFTFDEPVSCDSAMQRGSVENGGAGGVAWREHVFMLMACCMLCKTSSANASGTTKSQQNRHDDEFELRLKQRVTQFLMQMSEKLVERSSTASDICLLLGFMLFSSSGAAAEATATVLKNKILFLSRLVENITARLEQGLTSHYEHAEARKLHGGSSSANMKAIEEDEHSTRFVLDYCTLQAVSYLLAREMIIPALASKRPTNIGENIRALVHLDFEFHMLQLLLSSSSATTNSSPILCRMLTVLLNWEHFADLVVDAVAEAAESKLLVSKSGNSLQWWTNRAHIQRFIEQCLLLLTSTRHKTLQHYVLDLLHDVLAATTATESLQSVSRRGSTGAVLQKEPEKNEKVKALPQSAAPQPAVASSSQQNVVQQQPTASSSSSQSRQSVATQPANAAAAAPPAAPAQLSGKADAEVMPRSTRNDVPLPTTTLLNNKNDSQQIIAQNTQQKVQQQPPRRSSADAALDTTRNSSNITAANFALAARPIGGSGGGGRLGLGGARSPTSMSRQVTTKQLPPITEDGSGGSLSSPPIADEPHYGNFQPRSSQIFAATAAPSGPQQQPPLHTESRLNSAAASTTTLASSSSSTDAGSYIYPSQYLNNSNRNSDGTFSAEQHQPLQNAPTMQQQQQQQNESSQVSPVVAAAGVADSYGDFGYSIPYEGGDDDADTQQQPPQQQYQQQPFDAATQQQYNAAQQYQASAAASMPANSRPAMVGAAAFQPALPPPHNNNHLPYANQNFQQNSSRLVYGYENNNVSSSNYASPAQREAGGAVGGDYGDDEDRRTFDDEEEGTSSQTGSVIENIQQQVQNSKQYNSFVHYPEDGNYQQHRQTPQQQQQQPQQQQYNQHNWQQQPQQQYNQPTVHFASPIVDHQAPPSNHAAFQHQQSMPANFFSQNQQQRFDTPNNNVGSGSEYNSAYGSSGSGTETNKNDTAEKPANANAADSSGGGAMKKSGGFLRTISNYLPQRLVGGGATPPDLMSGSGGGGGKGAAAVAKAPKKMVLPVDKNPQFVFENGMWIDKKNPQASLAALAPPPPPPAGNSGTSTPSSNGVAGGVGMLSDFYRLGHPASSPNLRAIGGGGGPHASGGMPPSMPMPLFGPPI